MTASDELAIAACGLTMTYRASVREAGLRAAVGSLFHRQVRLVDAVRALDLEVHHGEMVGFLGPNGAGKTTTMKMLAGVLHPSGGDARVLGYTPWRRQDTYLRRIALVRGSRPLDAPIDLTVLDALRFQQLVYEVPDHDFRVNLGLLSELLDLGHLLSRQLRGLSLGERMRAGLANSLLYRPQVLFLDEPTLGLDVTATAAVRRFFAEYRAQTGATILLTSHYMADVASLCRRVVLIDSGQLRYDGELSSLAARLAPWKILTVALPDGTHPPAWSSFGERLDGDGGDGRVRLRVPRHDTAAVTARLLAELDVADLSVEDPPLEAVMDQLYRDGTTTA